jgi:hypothetical protein
MKSWRTSLFGVGGVVTIIGATLNALFDGDPATVVDWVTVCAGLAPAIGLLFARDNKVSSEQAGADTTPKV